MTDWSEMRESENERNTKRGFDVTVKRCLKDNVKERGVRERSGPEHADQNPIVPAKWTVYYQITSKKCVLEYEGKTEDTFTRDFKT